MIYNINKTYTYHYIILRFALCYNTSYSTLLWCYINTNSYIGITNYR